MKTMKRLATLLLVLCMLATMLPTVVFAETVASGTCGKKLTWVLDDDGTLTISGTGAMYNWGSISSIPWDDYRASIKTIVFTDGVTTICNYAFSICTNLTSVIISDSVTSIGNNAFYNCASLTDIAIPNHVITIGNNAFSDCGSLSNITIGDRVTSIGRAAFYNCTSLTSVTVPDSVTSIGMYAFRDCTSLTGICVDEGNMSYCSDSAGILFNKDKTTLIQAPGALLGSYTINDSITSINGNAFSNCTSLTGIILPESVISIGDDAFSNCTSLTGIMLPESMISIGDDAFSNCISLTGITIPDSVTSIGSNAFYNCTNLSKIAIGSGVVTIGNGAFYGCTNLSDVYVTDPIAWCNIKFAYLTANPMCYGNKIHILDEEGNEVTDIMLDASVTVIPDYVFKGCTNLTSITIPDSVTSIGDDAFFNCTSLTNVMIPDSLTSIGGWAFYGCTSLTNVTISSGVTSIGNCAFYHCDGLTDVYYTAGESQWRAISKGEENDCLTSATIHFNHIHDYSLFPVVIEESNCTEDGYTEYTCIYGDTYRVARPALGHICGADATVVEPSCTTQGYTVSLCTTCGETVETNQVPALGHDYSGNVTVVEPTCQSQGYTVRICLRCDEINKTDWVDAVAHTMVIVPSVAATCTTAGMTMGSCCKWCGMVGVAGKVVPATGHNFTQGVCAACGQLPPAVVTDNNGNVVGNYATFAEALEAAVPGSTLTLQKDLTEADVILTAGVNLDLNGYTLTVDSVFSYSSSTIIDSSENATGLLKINDADGNMISADNSQLPVYDNEAGGYRFIAIDVEPCAVTGGNKYWFKIKVEKFAPLYELIQWDAEVQIKVKMIWDGQTEDTYAVADLSFTKTWADRYNANEDIYITVTATEAEGLENFKLIPMITSRGVEISGEEM